MAKQATRTRKPTAKKAIKAVKSTARDVSSAQTAAAARRNKKAVLQAKREEAQRRAREWAKRELGGKKVASSLFPPASSIAPVIYSSEDEEDDEDADDEDEEGSINVNPNNCNQHISTQTHPFAGSHQNSVRAPVDAESVEDDDIFFDAMEVLTDDFGGVGVDPDAAESTSAPPSTNVNIRDFHSARRQYLSSKQVQFQQQSTKPRPSLDPVGYSFSTFVSKPNP